MIRRTISAADLLLAVPAGAVILVMLITGVMLGFERQPQQNAAKSGVMLMNRIGPSTSQLYVARSDGAEERKLFAGASFDYHASYTPDGKWIVFTSERNGLGQADIYRARPDGTDVEQLTDSPSLDDQAAFSPDGAQLAFVSTREMHTANIWILDLRTRRFRNLTADADLQGDPAKPNGFFRPSWSPDGKWIAFSSDRNTEWRGHSSGAGWEHVQELSIYVMRADGTGLRRVTQPGICAGAPKWSANSRRVIFYEIPVEQTWAAHWPGQDASTTSQIVSVDVNSGERQIHTAGPGLKVMPQFLADEVIGYLLKAGPKRGLAYTGGDAETVIGTMRSPAWSPDGKHVVYERVGFGPRPQNLLLFSWDPAYEYRYSDVFPSFSTDGKLLLTRKDGDSSLDIMEPDGSNRQEVFPSNGGTAFSPSWSPDGQRIVFGYGGFLQARSRQPAKIMMVRRDGTNLETLTEGTPNAGFPSWSADGTRVVYRVWGGDVQGLRILNISDRSVSVLTTDYDNLPYWSPDGQRIVFTRRHGGFNFDIFTIRPDGSDLRQLTTSPANDAHATWTDDGQYIMWSSGMYGWKEEAALYDQTFQPYGQIFIMKADGSEKRQLTDSLWEDSMPRFIPGASRKLEQERVKRAQ
jgi:Tol biopolymer transport system component